MRTDDPFTSRPDSCGTRCPPVAALAVLVTLVAGGCGTEMPRPARHLLVASTTSTEDSGLFDVLIPAFERAHPAYDVKLIAVGTGQALELGRRRDADILLVHAPPAESVFVTEGHGTERRPVMYNDFVIVGPPGDPAGVRGLRDAAHALGRIAAARAPFISRGDDSGTHRKERALWDAAEPAEPGPAGEWYLEAGQGMGEVLRIASEKGAYTLTDRATYLFLEEEMGLRPLVEGDERLFNQYAVIPVAGARNASGAAAFAEWVTSPAGQAVIRDYGVAAFGRPLFVPNASSGRPRARTPGAPRAGASGRAAGRGERPVP